MTAGTARIWTMASPVAPRRILIIEDNADAADSLARLLGIYGHRVDVARSGYAGLAAAIATRPEVILLDLGMPGLDGYEVASRLRATGRLRGRADHRRHRVRHGIGSTAFGRGGDRPPPGQAGLAGGAGGAAPRRAGMKSPRGMSAAADVRLRKRANCHRGSRSIGEVPSPGPRAAVPSPRCSTGEPSSRWGRAEGSRRPAPDVHLTSSRPDS